MLKLLALTGAGAAGTLARYGLTSVIHRYFRQAFPLGTLAVNVVGCFLIGLVMHIVVEHRGFTPETRTVIVAGFLGAFTTFSAFGYETITLFRGGALGLTALNVVGNVVIGIAAIVLGEIVGRAVGI